MIQNSTKRKVIVVGQTPPPYHGQAIMIETMLKGKYENLDLIHVRMDFSESIDEIGHFSFRKILKLFRLIREILLVQKKHKAEALYYPPAGDDVNPILRDILILILVRPFFKKTIFHFHAAGLLQGYEKLAGILRPLFRLAYGKPSNCLNLSEKLPQISHFLGSQRHTVLPHGINDPSQGFIRNKANPTRNILFVGAVRESKGVINLLEAADRLNTKQLNFHINIVGEFVDEAFKQRTQAFVNEHNLTNKITFHGLLKGQDKWKQFEYNDIFCFPTFYENESFGIVLLEALAFGLPIVTSDWRATTDIVLEPTNGFHHKSKDSLDLSNQLEKLITLNNLSRYWDSNRKRFLDNYTTSIFTKKIDTSMFGDQP